MKALTRYENVIIGAGQAGPFLAAELAKRGQRTALIERRALGGTCVNDGCTPTKTLRKSARVAYLVARAEEFGVSVDNATVDFAKALARAQTRADEGRAGLSRWLGSLPNLEVVMAQGALAGKSDDGFAVRAGERHLQTRRVFLNVGTRPFVPPVPGMRNIPFLTNETILKLTDRPSHLIVLGGSYIGLEYGQIFRRLGSKVTVLEQSKRIVAREDDDVANELGRILVEEGLDVRAGIALQEVQQQGGEILVTLTSGEVVRGSHLLVATGRVPNTDGLGLESIGLEPNARGYIKTNGRLETEVPGVWALGDINQRGAFTHTSYQDHEVVLANLSGDLRTVDDRISTYAMFTDPPLGHVGAYENDARRLVSEGRRISQAVFAMKNVSRAKEESETGGLIKLLVDEDSGHFVGATMLGFGADEVIQAIGLVMAAKGKWQDVRNALPVHPTVLEFLPTILDKRQPIGDGV